MAYCGEYSSALDPLAATRHAYQERKGDDNPECVPFAEQIIRQYT